MFYPKFSDEGDNPMNYTLHNILLYKSNKTIWMFYRTFADEGDNPVNYTLHNILLYKSNKTI